MKGITSRVVISFGIIILLIVVIMEVLFYAAVRQYYIGNVTEALMNRATTAAAFYNKYLDSYGLKEKAKYILENLSKDEVAKIEILDMKGKVYIDSFGFSSAIPTRTPDVKEALQGHTGYWNGRSSVTGERVLAVSNPLTNDQTMIGVLRYSISLDPLYKQVDSITLWALGVGVAVVLLSLSLSFLLARRIVEPIRELTGVAKLMATGDFSHRAGKRSDDEVGTLAETLNFMADELGRSEKLKNDFISSVSHELRTPLTSIKGWGETLLSGNAENREETLLGLEVIKKETDRLAGLVEELLDFSKYHAGEMKIHETHVNLREVLADVRQQYRYKALEHDISFQTVMPDDPLPIMGDANRLKQVMINLLDNAFKFSKENGHVELVAFRREDSILFQVKDNGEGISAEDLPHVMEKFYKGKSKRSGSGLGLAICKEIVELHHGQMKIESYFGEGTTVTVWLPGVSVSHNELPLGLD